MRLPPGLPEKADGGASVTKPGGLGYWKVLRKAVSELAAARGFFRSCLGLVVEIDAVNRGIEREVLENGEEKNLSGMKVAIFGHFTLIDNPKAVALEHAISAARFVGDNLPVDLRLAVVAEVFQEDVDHRARGIDAPGFGPHVEMKMGNVGRREGDLLARLGENPADVPARGGVVRPREIAPQSA